MTALIAHWRERIRQRFCRHEWAEIYGDLRADETGARIFHEIDVMRHPLCNSDLRGINAAFNEYDNAQPPTPGRES